MLGRGVEIGRGGEVISVVVWRSWSMAVRDLVDGVVRRCRMRVLVGTRLLWVRVGGRDEVGVRGIEVGRSG